MLPLALPEHARVEVRIVTPPTARSKQPPVTRQQIYDALIEAGLVKAHTTESSLSISETDLLAAANALAVAGPISELIIAERAESY